jgi:hypothetical protein
MSNDIVLQITQATQRTFPLHHFKVLQPLPLSDDELDADDEADAPFRGSANKRARANTISRGKTSDDETPSWTEHDMGQSQSQPQDHIQVLKACCVRNTPIVSNWLYQNITSLSMYLLKTALAQLRKITA